MHLSLKKHGSAVGESKADTTGFDWVALNLTT
jgi:hypothetical protein